MPIDNVNIQNNRRDDDLIKSNFHLFKKIVLKKGYKERRCTITEYKYRHRYVNPKMYAHDYSDYQGFMMHNFSGIGIFQLDHPRYYTTGDNKKVQVCSLYCYDLGKHETLINDGWVVIKPIYSTQARSYMRFVNVNAMRSQIRGEILQMKLNCFKKRLERNITRFRNSTLSSEQTRLRKEAEKYEIVIHKTYALLAEVQRKITLMRANEIDTDLSELLITD